MSLAGSKPVAAADVVADTWERLGITAMRPMGTRVLVRTEIPAQITKGGIILTDKQSSFYAGLPNVGLSHKPGGTKMVFATVVAFSEKATEVQVGDKLLFPRGLFERYKELDDKSMVGWIREEDIYLIFEPEDGDEVA